MDPLWFHIFDVYAEKLHISFNSDSDFGRQWKKDLLNTEFLKELLI